MKKVLVLVLLVSFLVSGFTWKTKEAFEKYKNLKAHAIELENAGDLLAAAEAYSTTGSFAKQEGVLSIAAWQYNNAGYCLLKLFFSQSENERDKALLIKAEKYFRQALSLDKDNKKALSNLKVTLKQLKTN